MRALFTMLNEEKKTLFIHRKLFGVSLRQMLAPPQNVFHQLVRSNALHRCIGRTIFMYFLLNLKKGINNDN